MNIKNIKNLRVVTILIVVASLIMAFGCKSKNSQETKAKNPKPLFHWVQTVSEDQKISGFQIETRLVLEPQFHNNITGQSGRHYKEDHIVPGPSLIADGMAQRQGINAVLISKHAIWIGYDKGFLSTDRMEGNIYREIDTINLFLEVSLGQDLDFVQDPTTRFIEPDTYDWPKPIITRIDTLYIPKTWQIKDIAAIESLPGITSVDDYEDGCCPGTRRIHKSSLYTWEELGPKIQPLL